MIIDENSSLRDYKNQILYYNTIVYTFSQTRIVTLVTLSKNFDGPWREEV